MPTYAPEQYREISRDNYIEEMLHDYDPPTREVIAYHFAKVLDVVVSNPIQEPRLSKLANAFRMWTVHYSEVHNRDAEIKRVTTLLTLMYDVGWDNGIHPLFKEIEFDLFMQLNGLDRKDIAELQYNKEEL